MNRCPVCRHPVDERATACPNCPASWDSDEDIAYRRRHAFRFHNDSPFLWIPLVGAALYGAWRGLEFVMAWGNSESSASPIVRFVDSRSRLPDTPQVLRTAGWGDSGAVKVDGKRSQPDQPAAAAPLERTAKADRAAPFDWRFTGRVIDLVTLQPIGRCPVILVDSGTGKRYETSTDSSGAYRISVPGLERRGYSLVVRKGGYSSSYLNPGTEHVPRMSDQDRKALARDLAHSLDGPYTVEAYGDGAVVTDVYLAPVSDAD